MSLTTLANLDVTDTMMMGLCEFAPDGAEPFVFPSKASAGTAAQYAMDDDEDATALWRLTRETRKNEATARAATSGKPVKSVLGREYARHMDRVAARINALPRDERVEAVRRWKDVTGEPCPRGVTLRD